MPLNVGRFYTSIFLFITFFACAALAQNAPVPQNQASTTASPQIEKAPTAAEVMRERISKAKAFIAVRNYNAAIYELEQIRRESGDPSVRSVTNVLLMNSYLEQGDYKRAQAMLTDYFIQQKSSKPDALENYSTLAGQVVKGARNQADRYRALGLSVMDRNLPLEAITDLEKMRETLELVIQQANEIGADKAKSSTAMALIEEATGSRALIARDEYDAKRWRDAVADSREEIASSRSVVVNAVDMPGTSSSAPPANQVAANTASPVTTPPLVNKTVDSKAVSTPPTQSVRTELKPVPTKSTQTKTDTPTIPEKPAPMPVNEPQPSTVKTTSSSASTTPERKRVIAGEAQAKSAGSKPAEAEKTVAPNPEKEKGVTKPSGPLKVGSLISYASKQTPPRYPATARAMRASGVVKVEILVDEEGNVAEVKDASGPVLLQASARDAILKWKFHPFIVDGQAVKATGFVSFNFSM